MKYFKKLVGERIYLSPRNLEDVEKYTEWMNDFNITDYTGRSHQIRVQMAKQLNLPIYGDFKYGDNLHKSNLALWSYELTFTHPTTKQVMRFVAQPDYTNSIFKLFEKTIEELINN